MKIRLDVDGKVFEYEKEPMPESHFKALCGLAKGGLYVSLAWVVATLCGFLGVLLMGVLTLLIGMMKLM